MHCLEIEPGNFRARGEQLRGRIMARIFKAITNLHFNLLATEFFFLILAHPVFKM